MKPKHPKLRWHDWKNEYLPLYPKADERECYSLDACLARFLLPRLKMFRKDLSGHPCGLNLKQWEAILDEMIYGFEFPGDDHFFENTKLYNRIKRESNGRIWNHPEVKASIDRAKKGRILFAEWFGSLWT